MRPATLVLLISGVGLLLGAALVASFKIPCREEHRARKHSIDFEITVVCCNAWGQPLWAFAESDFQVNANNWIMGGASENGPFPGGARQGKWRRITPVSESDIWYLDDREVSAAEWEQRQ